MSASKKYHVESTLNGEPVEYEYTIEVDSYIPVVPAQLSGPPDRWSPEEGGEIELNDAVVRRRVDIDNGEAEEVSLDVFLAEFAVQCGYQDDPADKKWFHQKAADKALDRVRDEMFDECQDNARDAYEARGDVYDERDL